MNRNLKNEFNKLESKIKSGNYIKTAKNFREWGGADVIITKELTPEIKRWYGHQNIVISPQNTAPMKRVVITQYSHELSWLFMQLRDVCKGYYDYISKYDLFGGLTQTALNQIEENEEISCNDLLMSVFNRSKELVVEINPNMREKSICGGE